jgi:haloacid dehalogenase-like hydrolase/AAA domain
VMILPAGVNKASGLIAALKEMNISPHNVVGIGDAENDHAFLRLCEMSVAVANALPAVMETADLVTAGDHGRGVRELIEGLVANDLADLNLRLQRHHLELGTSDSQKVMMSPYGQSVLICGPSASGKSTVATRIVESLQERQYQFCLIDPEGDYDGFEGAIMFGGPKAAPQEDEILRLLEDPNANAVVCLTGMPIADRPPFFLQLLSRLLQMRSRTSRPHWLILDEAHHLMPAEWLPPDGTLPKELTNVVLITVHPDLLSATLLERVDTALVVGANARDTLMIARKGQGQPGSSRILQKVKCGSKSPLILPFITRGSPIKVVYDHRLNTTFFAGWKEPPGNSVFL